MTDDQARTAASVVMFAAAASAAIYVVKTPPLRRAAWQFARRWATGPAAAWIVALVLDSWERSTAD